MLLNITINQDVNSNREDSQDSDIAKHNLPPKLSKRDLHNITIISDGYGDDWGWNDKASNYSAIEIDDSGNLHVVWSDGTDHTGKWGTDTEIMYAKYSEASNQWSNATVISDGYMNVWGWNDRDSLYPDIAIDSSNNIHVVWSDKTAGKWGPGYIPFSSIIDSEIFYINWTASDGWSNITVISDGYGGVIWNNGTSNKPAIAIDNLDNIHVVWVDGSDHLGKWGIDPEIMYVNRTASGWSNATVISDGYSGTYWNDDDSDDPRIAINSKNQIYVVYSEDDDGTWGTDTEIMCVNRTNGGWSNVTVVSIIGYSNTGHSLCPDIAIDRKDDVHIVWQDATSNPTYWGNDIEIMHTSWSTKWGWEGSRIVSDGYMDVWGWNDGNSLQPRINIDSSGAVRAVWYDDTNGTWGTDYEIMYSHLSGDWWVNATVISDGAGGIHWNDYKSENADFAVDDSGTIHFIWTDDTNGIWGSDKEIMYSTFVLDSDNLVISDRKR
jgi:hypothetical protein